MAGVDSAWEQKKLEARKYFQKYSMNSNGIARGCYNRGDLIERRTHA